MKPHLLIFLLYILPTVQAQNNLTQYVNPFVGTGGHGHTFPGATTPFAMVQLSPDTRIDGSWDGCSGYHYSDKLIYGFSHTHLSGTGCSDYGDIAFFPGFNDPTKLKAKEVLSAGFDHKNESAAPGYYSVLLNNGIKVELTASTRVGLQKYTFNKAGYAWITLNLLHRDELLEGKITQSDKRTFSGLRRSKAWAEDQLVYFYFCLNRDAEKVVFSKNERGETMVHLGFTVGKGQSLLVKTALSTVDENGAKNNLLTEIPGWDFQKVKAEANASWDNELQRIKVYGGTLTEKKNFYTALYHCMIHPNILNDVDGRYRGRDKEIHVAEEFNYYTVFSLWDTYRALHPLLNIIDKKRSHDFIMTLKAQYEQSGRLPMWELWGNETNCMIGFHSVSVIWNAYINKVISRDELINLYPAVYSEAMSNRFGLDKFRERGYLTIEDEHESVSKTLEYAYNMFCVSNIAFTIGRNDDYKYFYKYSQAWRNLRNVGTGFMTPRSNGAWIKDFDPTQVNNHFTEANSWQYSFAVQHDANSLFEINDPQKRIFDQQLLSKMFNTGSKTSGREQADITGLIGQYAHGNEPSHHMAYLFHSRDSIAKYVTRICSEMYQPIPDGLIGNEDCGQMSAWYVFSAMGFYPADPSKTEMTLGKMLFDSVRFIQGDRSAVMINSYPAAGKWTSPFVDKISIGRSDVYYAYFNKSVYNSFGPGYSLKDEIKGISAPVLEFGSNVFPDSMGVKISVNDKELEYTSVVNYDILYVFEGEDSTYIYTPGTVITILKSCKLKAWIRFTNSLVHNSDRAEAEFFKFSNHYDIDLKSKYNKQYTAGGDKALFDGLRGDADWRKGRWQGYQAQDFDLLIDTKETIHADTLIFGTLQDTRSWILFPKSILVYGSNDTSRFELIGQYNNNIPDSMMNSTRADFKVPCNGKPYRYYRIVARNYGKLPPWHPGAGGEAFIFVDELEFRYR